MISKNPSHRPDIWQTLKYASAHLTKIREDMQAAVEEPTETTSSQTVNDNGTVHEGRHENNHTEFISEEEKNRENIIMHPNEKEDDDRENVTEKDSRTSIKTDRPRSGSLPFATRDENSSNSVDLASSFSQYDPEEESYYYEQDEEHNEEHDAQEEDEEGEYVEEGEEDYSYYHDDDEEEEEYDDDLDTIGMDLAAIARGMQTVSLTREDVHHSIEPHHALQQEEHEEEETKNIYFSKNTDHSDNNNLMNVSDADEERSRRLELSREGRELISNSLSQDDIEHALATSIALHQRQQQQQQHQARCSEPYEEEEKMDRETNVQEEMEKKKQQDHRQRPDQPARAPHNTIHNVSHNHSNHNRRKKAMQQPSSPEPIPLAPALKGHEILFVAGNSNLTTSSASKPPPIHRTSSLTHARTLPMPVRRTSSNIETTSTTNNSSTMNGMSSMNSMNSMNGNAHVLSTSPPNSNASALRPLQPIGSGHSSASSSSKKNHKRSNSVPELRPMQARGRSFDISATHQQHSHHSQHHSLVSHKNKKNGKNSNLTNANHHHQSQHHHIRSNHTTPSPKTSKSRRADLQGSYGTGSFNRRSATPILKPLAPIERTPSPFKVIKISKSNTGASPSPGLLNGTEYQHQHSMSHSSLRNTNYTNYNDPSSASQSPFLRIPSSIGVDTSHSNIVVDTTSTGIGASFQFDRNTHGKKKSNQLTPRNDLPVPQISPATVHEKPLKRRNGGGGGRVKVSGWTSQNLKNKERSPPLFR